MEPKRQAAFSVNSCALIPGLVIKFFVVFFPPLFFFHGCQEKHTWHERGRVGGEGGGSVEVSKVKKQSLVVQTLPGMGLGGQVGIVKSVGLGQVWQLGSGLLTAPMEPWTGVG